MVIGYINSKWSMPRRLALIAAVFLIPSLVQLYLFADHKLQRIDAIEREIDGQKLVSAVWARMSEDNLARLADNDSGELANTAKDLGVEPATAAFEGARTPVDRVHRGIELLDQIASASGISVDPSEDSYHAQDV